MELNHDVNEQSEENKQSLDRWTHSLKKNKQTGNTKIMTDKSSPNTATFFYTNRHAAVVNARSGGPLWLVRLRYAEALRRWSRCFAERKASVSSVFTQQCSRSPVLPPRTGMPQGATDLRTGRGGQRKWNQLCVFISNPNSGATETQPVTTAALLSPFLVARLQLLGGHPQEDVVLFLGVVVLVALKRGKNDKTISGCQTHFKINTCTPPPTFDQS